MNALFGTVAAIALVPGAILAQTNVLFPAEYATIEAENYVYNYPFSGGVTRYQTVFLKETVGLDNGAAITAIGVRPDGYNTGTGHRVQMEIWMGHTTRWDTGGTNLLTGVFDNNYEGSLTLVYGKKTLQLPNLTPPTTPPATNHVMVTLDRSFTYDRSRNLVVEFRVFANDNANQAFFYPIDFGSGYSVNDTFGVACPTSNGTLPAHTTTGPVLGGNAWWLQLSQGAGSTAAAFFLGVSKVDSFGLPLPFDLAVIGAPSCFLNVELRLTLPGQTDLWGNASKYIPAPDDLQFFGSTIYTQVAMIDVFANSLGVVTSNGASSKVGAVPQAVLIYAFGDANAANGIVYGRYGAVTVFQHQ